MYGSHCCSLLERLLTLLWGQRKNSGSKSNAQSHSKLLYAGVFTKSGDGEMTARNIWGTKGGKDFETHALIFYAVLAASSMLYTFPDSRFATN